MGQNFVTVPTKGQFSILVADPNNKRGIFAEMRLVAFHFGGVSWDDVFLFEEIWQFEEYESLSYYGYGYVYYWRDCLDVY